MYLLVPWLLHFLLIVLLELADIEALTQAVISTEYYVDDEEPYRS